MLMRTLLVLQLGFFDVPPDSSGLRIGPVMGSCFCEIKRRLSRRQWLRGWQRPAVLLLTYEDRTRTRRHHHRLTLLDIAELMCVIREHTVYFKRRSFSCLTGESAS
jgi:hypothetical protein